jgi:hypothetical protein
LSEKQIKTKSWGMAQVVEHLPSKREALSPTPYHHQNKKKKGG